MGKKEIQTVDLEEIKNIRKFNAVSKAYAERSEKIKRRLNIGIREGHNQGKNPPKLSSCERKRPKKFSDLSKKRQIKRRANSIPSSPLNLAGLSA